MGQNRAKSSLQSINPKILVMVTIYHPSAHEIFEHCQYAAFELMTATQQVKFIAMLDEIAAQNEDLENDV